MTDKTEMSDAEALAEKLTAYATDPMWTAHAEVPKRLLNKVIARLRAVDDQQPEAEAGAYCRIAGCVHHQFGEPVWPDGENPFAQQTARGGEHDFARELARQDQAGEYPQGVVAVLAQPRTERPAAKPLDAIRKTQAYRDACKEIDEAIAAEGPCEVVAWMVTTPNGEKFARTQEPNLTEPGYAKRPLCYALSCADEWCELVDLCELETHVESWRNALLFAQFQAKGTENESVWEREIAAFDKAFAAFSRMSMISDYAGTPPLADAEVDNAMVERAFAAFIKARRGAWTYHGLLAAALTAALNPEKGVSP